MEGKTRDECGCCDDCAGYTLDLEEERRQLRARVAELEGDRAAVKRWREVHCELDETVTRLRARLDAVRAINERHKHHEYCGYWEEYECDCRYEPIRAALDGEMK